MRSTVVLVALVAAFMAASMTTAQSELGPERIGDILPSAVVFGEGWTTLGDSFVPEAFTDNSVLSARGQYYVSARGSRALVDVVMPGDSLRDARETWDVMASWTAAVEQHTYDDDSLDSYDLARMDPPAGCVDAKRGEGTSYIDSAEVGATLCDAGEGYYIYVMVSGGIENRGARYEYHVASDIIASAMLGVGPLARRAATHPA